MTKTIRINISSASSKAEEIDALVRIAKAIPAGTYLRDFFTAQLVDWVAAEIRQDNTPDVIGRMEWISKTTQDSCAEQHARDQQEIAALKTALRASEGQLTLERSAYRTLQATKETLSERVNSAWEHNRELSEEGFAQRKETLISRAKIEEIK